MKKIRISGYQRPILGILLIITALGGLLYWEMSGREVILMDEVLVAKEDIYKGTKVSKDMFKIAKILKENRVKGALMASEQKKAMGKTAEQLILKNDQISESYFENANSDIKKDQAFYVIKADWIDMRSSALRKGDFVSIYVKDSFAETKEEGLEGEGLLTSEIGISSCEPKDLGSFEVAFVKDSTEREVQTINEIAPKDLLERKDSTGIIDHIEIICTWAEYETIRSAATLNGQPSLMIVQKREG